MSRVFHLFFNRRSLALFLLGIASGVPLAISGDFLAAWLTDCGFDVKKIGLIGLVSFPYVLKVLWSPLIDRYAPPFLDRRRGWMVLTQLALIAALMGLATTNPRASLTAVAAMATLVTFLSATQDIVIDAWRADVLPPDERGPGVAMSVAGLRLGLVAGSAGALILVGRFSFTWPQACRAVAALMGIGVLATLFAPQAPSVARPKSLYEAVGEPLAELLVRRGGWMVILFAFVFKFPEHLANAMSVPFLMKLGFPMDQIGTIREGLGVAVTIFGAFVGGGVVSRIGLWRSLWIFGALHSISNLAFFALAKSGRNYEGMVAVVCIESFCIGLTTAAFMAWIISRCDVRHSAFQFALLTSLMALSRVICSPLAGWLAGWLGWSLFFSVSTTFGLPGLLLLFWMRPHTSSEQSAVSVDAMPSLGLPALVSAE